MKYVVEKNEQLKNAIIIRAEGEAEAARLIAEATVKGGLGILKSHIGLIALRKLETSLEITKLMARNPNISYVYRRMPKIIDMDKMIDQNNSQNDKA